MNAGNVDPRVCAVVVTWNRKDLLFRCLQGLHAQTRAVNGIVIVDNAGSDGSWDALFRTYENRSDIHLFRMSENTGGSGGFSYGIERAVDMGYDWIWIMDDDAEPTPSCLETLWATEERQSGDHVLCPLIQGDDSLQIYHHKNIDLARFRIAEIPSTDASKISIQGNAFVGPLFPSSLVRQHGLPKTKYFIWWDDTEYTFRISDHGRRMVLVTAAVILHHDKQAGATATSWKCYYDFRNSLDFIASNLHGLDRLRAASLRIARALRFTFQLLRKRDPHWKLPLRGIADYFRGRWGVVVRSNYLVTTDLG